MFRACCEADPSRWGDCVELVQASDWLVGGGEIRELIRRKDWSSTPLGVLERWPQSLRTAAALVVESKNALCLAWGSEWSTLYNEAFRTLVNDQTAGALGRPIGEIGTEFRSRVLPGLEVLRALGESVQLTRVHLPSFDSPERAMRRLTATIHLTPLRLENSRVGGALIVVDTNAERPGAASVEQLQSFVRCAPLSVAMLDREMNYLVTSDRWTSDYGRGLKNLAGLNHYEFNPDLPEAWKHVHERVLAGETVEKLDERWDRADGSKCWVSWAVVPWRDDSGAISGVIISVEDITKRKEAEEMARLYERSRERALDADALERLQRVGSKLLREDEPNAVLHEILDAAIAITEADFGNVQMLDPDAGDLRIVVHRGFPEPWVKFWSRASKGHGACGTALERKQRVIIDDVARSPAFDDAARAVQLDAGVRAVQSTPLFSRSGKLIGMLSTHYRHPRRPSARALGFIDLLARQTADFLERSLREEALRRSEALLTGVLMTSADGFVSINREQRIVQFNRGAENIFGYSSAEVVGAPLEILIPERLREAHRAHVAAFAARAPSARSMGWRKSGIVGLRKNGEEFPADIAVSKVQVDGEIALTATIRDVTDERILATLGATLNPLETEQPFKKMATLLAENLGDYCVVFGVDECGRLQPVAAACRDPAKGSLADLVMKLGTPPSAHPAQKCFREGAPGAKHLASMGFLELNVVSGVSEWPRAERCRVGHLASERPSDSSRSRSRSMAHRSTCRGEPRVRGCPNENDGFGFMKPSANAVSPPKNSSRKPCRQGSAGGARAANVSDRCPSSAPPAAKTDDPAYAFASARAVPIEACQPRQTA